MRSFTRPPDASAHLSAISLSRLCQVEPFGARVPSLIVTSCAEARGAAVASATASASFLTCSPSASAAEEVVGVREEEPRSPLGQRVREPVGLVGLDVGREHLVEEALELSAVLPRDRHRLGVGDERTELLALRERQRAVEVPLRSPEPRLAALRGVP